MRKPKAAPSARRQSSAVLRAFSSIAFVLMLSVSAVLGQATAPRASTQHAALTGTVVDKTGSTIAGAKVILFLEENAPGLETLSGSNGEFSFGDLPPGPYRLKVSAASFGEFSFSGDLKAGETEELPPVLLNVAVVTSDVVVTMTRTELAQAQIKEQEEQRVLGFVPNFYASYLPDAVPLTSKQKFQLAFKATTDPMAFALTGVIAGVRQARNDYSGFGQGVEGYAKRYGAGYGNFITGTMLSEAVFPSLFKQDPRYFYKGTGTVKSRLYYAVSRAVVRKGDNGNWQPNYSGILGQLAAGGISNFYYPAKDRNGVGLTFENALISIAGNAFGNVMQEFVLKSLTPKVAGLKKPKN